MNKVKSSKSRLKKIKTILFNFDFANNTVLSGFFFFFLVINLYFLNPTVIVQISNPIAEFEIPTGTPNKEAKAEVEKHPVMIETKIKKYSI